MKNLYVISLLAFLGLSNANAEDPNFLWAKRLGGVGEDNAYYITVDIPGGKWFAKNSIIRQCES